MRRRRSLSLVSWIVAPVLCGIGVAGCGTTEAPSPGTGQQTPTSIQPPDESVPLSRCSISAFHIVVIELAKNAQGVCEARVNTADKLPTLTTHRGFDAIWDVCNRCDEPVDVRLRSFSPRLDEIFERTQPQMSAANDVELPNVRPHQIRSIRGWVRGDAPRDAHYEFSWRVNGSPVWNDIDPRLEIVDTFRDLVTKLFKGMSPPPEP